MKKKYEVNLSSEYTVTFPDEQRIIDYYIDGDWKETFYTFSDIEDLIRNLMYIFVRTDLESQTGKEGEHYLCKDIEGFPTFIRDKDNRDLFVSSHEECGTIIVEREDELDVDYVTLKEEDK